MTSVEGDIVLPGDVIEEAKQIASTKRVILGPGLRQDDTNVIVCKNGILKKKKPNTFWVDSYMKRYVPIKGEAVIGIVLQKTGDYFRVDIGSSEMATLSYLAFEGATKKNRPDVNKGDLIFGRLLIADRDIEPELVCVDSHGKKGKLGILSDGFLFNCSINLVRKLLNEQCPLFECLSKEVPFELAAGMNGKIWIHGRNVKETIAVGNAILAAEYESNESIIEMCNKIGNALAGISS